MVVTTASAAPDFVALGAEFVHDSGDGLNVACLTAAVLAQPDSVAFLLGDVPSMLPDELSGALDLAATHPMAFVADAENDGTVLLTALNPADHIPRFGKHSRAAHLAAGYTELTLPSDSGLRRDVDTRDQLRAIPVSSLGTRTAAALEAINLNS